GTPVIATRVGFVNDYIKDGENGLFFKKSDPFDLSKKLKILIEDSKLREQFGQRGRHAILEEFSWDITAKRIGEAIEKVSNK
ncbi:glycosyltransferase, partial [archaeon]|nr:glycosyltransferase [archaeon]